MISRRSIMKLIGGGVVAGPKVAEEVLHASGVATGPRSVPMQSGVSMGQQFHPESGAIGVRQISQADRIREALRNLMEGRRERRRATSVYNLDPDLASFRSWSPSAKIEAQRKRNEEVEFGHTRSYLMKELERVIKEEI